MPKIVITKQDKEVRTSIDDVNGIQAFEMLLSLIASYSSAMNVPPKRVCILCTDFFESDDGKQYMKDQEEVPIDETAKEDTIS